MKFTFSVFTSLLFYVCTAQTAYESEKLKIIPINENILIHESYLNTDSWGKVGCNGMVFLAGDEAIVFDTPTDDAASLELIKWLEKERKVTIKAVVATHFHHDCLGGLRAFHMRKITSYAHHKTLSLLGEQDDSALPQHGFSKKLKLKAGREKACIVHMGEGHTIDNVVGYIPSEETLFGGCLVKSMNDSKGNLADANVHQWSRTVSRIKASYPHLQTVIPGHGKSGGPELLDYTATLFQQDQTKNQ